ncbi:MAG TPA: hypothetical protein VFH68_10425 [Polyangia bacterium]|jgi:hypothetical protein|nr:hypothetical protein [Polyangia bacterium]
MTASAARAEDIRAIVQKGNDLRRQGHDEAALAEFQRAARIENSPTITAQIALAEQALGLWVEANTHLSQALEHERDPWIIKNRKALDGARATIQAHLCRVEIWGTPGGAEVSLEGKPAGTLPSLTVWVAPGKVSLTARAEGFLGIERSVDAPAGGRIREHVALRPRPGPIANRAPEGGDSLAPSAKAPELTLVDQPKPISEAPPPPRAETGGTRWWLWTVVGVGVLAAAGTGTWLLTRSTCENCYEWRP